MKKILRATSLVTLIAALGAVLAGSALAAPVSTVTDSNFKTLVGNSRTPVVVVMCVSRTQCNQVKSDIRAYRGPAVKFVTFVPSSANVKVRQLCQSGRATGNPGYLYLDPRGGWKATSTNGRQSPARLKSFVTRAKRTARPSNDRRFNFILQQLLA